MFRCKNSPRYNLAIGFRKTHLIPVVDQFRFGVIHIKTAPDVPNEFTITNFNLSRAIWFNFFVYQIRAGDSFEGFIEIRLDARNKFNLSRGEKRPPPPPLLFNEAGAIHFPQNFPRLERINHGTVILIESEPLNNLKL